VLGRATVLLFWLAVATESFATPTFSLYFTNDPDGQFTSYYSSLSNNILAAADNWAQYFPATNNASILIEVQFVYSTTFLSSGFSVTSHFVTSTNGTNIFEQGAGAQVRTGGQSGSIPDIRFEIGTNYLVNTLWLDPNPRVRSYTVPPNKTDSMSVCLHELCHAFAFNGWMDGMTGAFPGNYESTFDQWVQFDGTNFYFYGPQAQSIYGKPVPVTYGNAFHVGNSSPRPGSDLIGDLMNGVVFTNGTRYYISSLDLAVMADTGLPIGQPLSLLADSQTNGAFRAEVAAPVGRSVRLEYSTTLTNWTALTNFITTNVTTTVTDLNATNASRFYRAVLK